ncbi:PREDICTED: rhophilin-1 [Condylura cristata]|uniref:rhophilin-1 n=1 Tax=Condylura cristata TaxID=143302 RepID=UPI0006435C4F|nr:PREDICTED: rhophilin-1 [Condylura cristata]
MGWAAQDRPSAQLPTASLRAPSAYPGPGAERHRRGLLPFGHPGLQPGSPGGARVLGRAGFLKPLSGASRRARGHLPFQGLVPARATSPPAPPPTWGRLRAEGRSWFRKRLALALRPACGRLAQPLLAPPWGVCPGGSRDPSVLTEARPVRAAAEGPRGIAGLGADTPAYGHLALSRALSSPPDLSEESPSPRSPHPVLPTGPAWGLPPVSELPLALSRPTPVPAVHRQISKELRIRTGAENLYRATSNARVRETVARELSDVNCSLQLLKEELEELGREDGAPPQSEGTAPMIPLGLKETRELDWATPLRELISRHFGEDGATYEAEIRELVDLRQVGAPPSSPACQRPNPAPLPGCRPSCTLHSPGPAGRRTMPGSWWREAHPPLPQEPEERRKLGKAHLRRAILGQGEAGRLHAECRALRRVDPLQATLAQALRRAMTKHAELDLEDDFSEAPEAPDIQPKTLQSPGARPPSFSRAETADIFHRLGPLSLFSAKTRWRLVGPVQVARGEGGFGFTLRGDAPRPGDPQACLSAPSDLTLGSQEPLGEGPEGYWTRPL